ncbi:uncharacterized protein LOC129884329 [Solanum dulcamara]|uniref:uncharacterized protein LOC129884329 n=1 Tax=Solanum dulcamara TaxID=45834 RepID=UPI0024868B4B|nr:uncharacterized protein LOC129884329 [Solanum dulcamara]
MVRAGSDDSRRDKARFHQLSRYSTMILPTEEEKRLFIVMPKEAVIRGPSTRAALVGPNLGSGIVMIGLASGFTMIDTSKYISDKSHVLRYDSIELDDHLTFVEQPIAVLARNVHQLYSSSIPVVKVKWQYHPIKEATWQIKQDMQVQYPRLFEPLGFRVGRPL